MRIENQTRAQDISQDCPAHNSADITIKIGKQTYVDSKIHDQEDDEILDDAVVSDSFEQQHITDEDDDNQPIKEVTDISEASEIDDIIIDQCDNQSDVHQLQKLLCPIRHMHDEVKYFFL